MTHACSIILEGAWSVPYVRIGRERWTPRARRYLASRDRIAAEWRAAYGPGQITGPVVVGVAVWLPVVLRGPRAGEMPCTGGDWDNWFKALLDAAVASGVIEDDSPDHVRGPGVVRVDGADVPSRVYAAASRCRRVRATIWTEE